MPDLVSTLQAQVLVIHALEFGQQMRITPGALRQQRRFVLGYDKLFRAAYVDQAPR